MNLRDGSVVGGSKGSLPSNSRTSRDFARGAARILGRWTALRLAVEGGWGGPESEAKAGLLLDDVVAWFACDSDHFADDLEVELEATMLDDFGAQLEDGSPREVARALVHLHSELLSGRTQALEALLALPELLPLGNSLRELVDRDGTVVATTTAARAARGGGGGGSSSSSDDDDDDEEMTEREQGVAPAAAAAAVAETSAPRYVKATPQIDEDGFQTVVRGGGRRR